MKPYPHHYGVRSHGGASGPVALESAGLPSLQSAPPAEFDGPGDLWSPESLLVAAVADCLILTFRGVARAAAFPWERLECTVEGLLERVAGVTQFSRFTTHAKLTVMAGSDAAKARELLERAEKLCLISNSLRGERILQISIDVSG